MTAVDRPDNGQDEGQQVCCNGYEPGPCRSAGCVGREAAVADGQRREQFAGELARHHSNWGARDDEQPDVWFSWCECGWADDCLDSSQWTWRYRLNVADELLNLLDGSP